MSKNFKLSPDNLRSETALVGMFIILIGIFLYTPLAQTISIFLRPLLMVIGGILVLSAAFSQKQHERENDEDYQDPS